MAQVCDCGCGRPGILTIGKLRFAKQCASKWYAACKAFGVEGKVEKALTTLSDQTAADIRVMIGLEAEPVR